MFDDGRYSSNSGFGNRSTCSYPGCTICNPKPKTPAEQAEDTLKGYLANAAQALYEKQAEQRKLARRLTELLIGQQQWIASTDYSDPRRETHIKMVETLRVLLMDLAADTLTARQKEVLLNQDCDLLDLMVASDKI